MLLPQVRAVAQADEQVKGVEPLQHMQTAYIQLADFARQVFRQELGCELGDPIKSDAGLHGVGRLAHLAAHELIQEGEKEAGLPHLVLLEVASQFLYI